ncbi:uncharacterized protein SKDI_09G1090 [Saccharomyces kudriavzevii IFO 1802]|uniref:Uncharacterized protein n=1 Tax=Saccharomyces kudriavzevii (strain ATCC MYA-4449 / AS 2.2408 / CBS 8840 / NBRC 1802 / NCYC 2889) TaxID=226230 RepID=A0AA35JLN1_SACK1|nr:uncharacterized protein SKDI_09G1090 [Saccharomyces kudriavzevii IFO 1802]CAI4064686.1 hypothetical protein SKDI_09G1090 [Saccharomyces kudriavzevii IFO 1802]
MALTRTMLVRATWVLPRHAPVVRQTEKSVTFFARAPHLRAPGNRKILIVRFSYGNHHHHHHHRYSCYHYQHHNSSKAVNYCYVIFYYFSLTFSFVFF